MRAAMMLLAALALAFAVPARACKCRDVPLDERVANAADVLLLRASGERAADKARPLAKADVLEAFKGAHRASETLWLDDFANTDCSAPSAAGAKFLAFGTSDAQGVMGVSACTTIPINDGAEGEAVLVRLRAVLAPRSGGS